MNDLYHTVTGRQPNMFIKILLKLMFFIILALTKIMFGMDWVFIVGFVIVVSDLDEIVDGVKKLLD